MIDAVISYHTNPLTCGVAKFNQQLAHRLGVPFGRDLEAAHPLLSLKASEMDDRSQEAFIRWAIKNRGAFDVLWHDDGIETIASCASRVFYAAQTGCPSTLEGNPDRGGLNVLLFGMAHKVETHGVSLERLRELLQRAHVAYTVSVSTAVHEGSPWDGAFSKTVDGLRLVFGAHLRVLGYLADDALAKELRDCSAVALFFDPAARANNTSLWAAMKAGAAVVTNLDAYSPPDLIHDQTVFDLDKMDHWPFFHLLDAVGSAGSKAALAHDWPSLLAVLADA